MSALKQALKILDVLISNLEIPLKDEIEHKETSAETSHVKIDNDSNSNPLKKLLFKDHDNLKLIAKYINSPECKQIIVLCGAGISVSAGIPDYRSKNGFFNTLDKLVDDPKLQLTSKQKSDIIECPEYIDSIELFEENPVALLQTIRIFYEKKYKPTKTHWFLRLLDLKGKLHRVYTQNVDSLELQVGISDSATNKNCEKILQCHGRLTSASCYNCSKEYPYNNFYDAMMNEKFPILCQTCWQPLVKPDVVLFGQGLPKLFHQYVYEDKDFENNCDLLIIIGTSLKVVPFATLPSLINTKICKRFVMNMEKLEFADDYGTEIDKKRNIQVLGECDKTVERLVDMLGWRKEFDQLLS